MIPIRLRQNQSDGFRGGFIDDDVTGIFPSGLASDDGCGVYFDERDCDGAENGPDGES